MADIKNHSTLTTGLVSYWDLEEASGTRYDLHGSNNLTDNNTVTQATGKVGNCGDFVYANDEYLSITDAAQSGLNITGSISFSAWVKTTSRTGQYHTILAKGNVGGYIFRINNNSKYVMYLKLGGTLRSVESLTSVTHGAWKHIAATYDGSTLRIYIDGTEDNTASFSGAIGTTADAFGIGKDITDGGTNVRFDGDIDEVGVWSKALTADEVSDLYNSGSGLPYYDPADVKNDTTLSTSLVSYWELEDTSDSHGSKTLTETGTPTYTTGKSGNGADFDGSVGEALSADGSTGFTMTNLASFSLSAWFKPNTAATSATLFARWAANNKGLLVMQDASDHVIAYVGDGNTTRSSITGTTDIDDTNWHHIVFVWDSSTDKHRIYVDGVFEVEVSTAQTISQSTANLEIGDDTQATSGSNYNGMVDEWGAWTKALTVSEVRALYGYGTPPVYDAGGGGGGSTFTPKIMMCT